MVSIDFLLAVFRNFYFIRPPLHSYAEERDFIGFGISEPKQAVNKLWLRRRKDRSLITSRTEWL
jgi:hypothetical protein